MAEICDKFSPIFSIVQQLDVDASFTLPSEQDDMDPLPLLELFRPFINVKRLFLADNVAHYVEYALKQEMATGVLPNIKVCSISSPASLGSSLAPPPGLSIPPPFPDVASQTHSPLNDPISPYPYPPQPIVYTPSPIPEAHALPFLPLPPGSRSLYLHPRLVAPNLRYDMHYNYTMINPELSPAVLAAPATHPPSPSLMLRIGGLPWLVFVRPDARLTPGSAIVTVQAVLSAIFVNLRIAVKPDEYKAMSESNKAALYEALERRVDGDPVQRGKGLLRIDFLCGRVRAKGLARAQSKDNLWNVVVY
jgi:hypothetical protein